MAGQWKEVTKLHFRGERFRDHALDLSALSELRQFQKMVAETAKILWRKANPDRKNLPQHFEDRTRLCLRRIEEGSAIAPLEVFIEEPDGPELWEKEPVEINEAIELAHRVFESVHNDAPIPEWFPRELLSEYAKWGRELAEDEVMEFAPPGKEPVRVTTHERDRLNELAEPPYTDEVDVTGRVLEADVRNKKFQLWSGERASTSIRISFTEAQESDVTTALKEHACVQLRVAGRGKFSPEGTLQEIIEVDRLELLREDEPEFDASAPAIEDVIADIFKDVSDEEWNSLPADLTDKLDFYLYGAVEE